jgi:uncharacterized membrane protein
MAFQNSSLYYFALARVVPSILVLAIAAAIRFPNYDVAWFGIDQVYFLAEARRILGGATDVVGPLSSGLNLLGPLYSYLLAGLLWIRNDAAFLGLFGAACEVVGAWFVFDAARRLAGTTAGVAASVTYAVSPILVLSTRLIWNPSLLPMTVAVGWWMAVRYAQKPTAWRLIGTALAAGCMLPLHPTGLFPAAGVVLAALLGRMPSIPQLIVAGLVGLLPLLPTILRMTRRAGDVGALGSLLSVPADALSTVPAVVTLLLSFPARLAPGDVTARIAAGSLYALAAIGTVGAVRGIMRSNVERHIWIGLAVTCAVYLAATAMYSGGLTWYYLLAFVPMCALFVAGAFAGLNPRPQLTGALLVVACAMTQVAFLYRFDETAKSTGLLSVNSSRVMIRRAPGDAYSLTMREVRSISTAIARVIPDGATALMSVHGIRGELWRESGAEFMPPSAAPQSPSPTQVTVVANGVCASTGDGIAWRAHQRALPGWETAQYPDSTWYPVRLPRHTDAPSLSADNPRFVEWRAPRLVLRGRYTIGADRRRRLLAVTAHSPPATVIAMPEIFVNGRPLAVSRERVMYGIYRNHEWLIDATEHVHTGENLIALGFASTGNAFDLDVFEVPCPDGEFYF